ncbi:MAG: hypothetical protein VX252_16295 [Myxococcota bacterium]|nr:hypothetical protein [Myxococcota bacterium]
MLLILFFFVGLVAVPTLADSGDEDAGMSAAEKTKKRAQIQKMVDQTLEKLYAAQPKAKKAIARSEGYAVFSNFGMKILVAGGGSGKGMAVDKTTGQKTYMKMLEVQAGIGLGVKKFQVIWVFDDHSDFNNFINHGWEFGGQATAAAKLNDDGNSMQGALSVKEGVWVYQLTGDGLALELTLKGTKYYKDKKLN